MYAQTWLYESSFDLRKDLAATAKQGKRLVIFWEQNYCFNCKPLYEVNLRIPRIVEKITKNFNVIKLDILGERMVTDLDGTTLSEEKLAMKSDVAFTPTLQFLPESLEQAAGRNIKEAEVFRSEGYFKPFHFNFLFHYVQSKGYENQSEFQRWLGRNRAGPGSKGHRIRPLGRCAAAASSKRILGCAPDWFPDLETCSFGMGIHHSSHQKQMNLPPRRDTHSAMSRRSAPVVGDPRQT